MQGGEKTAENAESAKKQILDTKTPGGLLLRFSVIGGEKRIMVDYVDVRAQLLNAEAQLRKDGQPIIANEFGILVHNFDRVIEEGIAHVGAPYMIWHKCVDESQKMLVESRMNEVSPSGGEYVDTRNDEGECSGKSETGTTPA